MARNIPADLPTEESLIGAVLINDHMVGELKHLVDPADFMKPQHQTMWASILAMHDEGEAIDPVTLAARCGLSLEVIAPLMAATPAVSSWRTYAERIIELSRRRHLIKELSRNVDMCFDGVDADDILTHVSTISDSHLIGSRHIDIDNLYSGVEFMAYSPDRQTRYPWLLPGLIRQRWRIIIVGPEGVGKGTLFRQLALHGAAGRDPFSPSERIEPVKTLYVDLENPETTIELQMKLANRMHGIDIVGEAGDNYQLWHQDSGIDIRKIRDQAKFEAVIQKVRPKLVFIGPFYKLFSRKSSEDLEQTTIEVLKFLDDMRTRYNFGLIIEHHLTKGQGLYRSKDPFGSSALMRWPEIGISLEPVDGLAGDFDIKTYNMSRFRADREPANWPNHITKNAPQTVVAWQGFWEHGR